MMDTESLTFLLRLKELAQFGHCVFSQTNRGQFEVFKLASAAMKAACQQFRVKRFQAS